MTYDTWKTTDDTWKTTDPDPYDGEPFGECDACGKQHPLTRCWVFGIETYVCDECGEIVSLILKMAKREDAR